MKLKEFGCPGRERAPQSIDKNENSGSASDNKGTHLGSEDSDRLNVNMTMNTWAID